MMNDLEICRSAYVHFGCDALIPSDTFSILTTYRGLHPLYFAQSFLTVLSLGRFPVFAPSRISTNLRESQKRCGRGDGCSHVCQSFSLWRIISPLIRGSCMEC